MQKYEYMFGEKPKECSSTMCEKDHPESHSSEEFDVIGMSMPQDNWSEYMLNTTPQ
jgi:hypothetical protein